MDLIDRQAAIDAYILHTMDYLAGKKPRRAFTEVLKELPAAQPERKKGRWIPSVDRWGDIVTTVEGYTCSNCDFFNADKDRFCPNCGADMRGEEHEVN